MVSFRWTSKGENTVTIAPSAARLLVEDAASSFLESLTPEERRSDYDGNGLPKGGPSFSEEEIKIAFDGFWPQG